MFDNLFIRLFSLDFIRMRNKFTNFSWQVPKIVASFPKGKDAEKLYQAYQEKLKEFSNTEWGSLKYNKDSQEIYGANNIDQGILNNILKDSGVRVAVPSDDFNQDIFNLIKDRNSAYFNANVVKEDLPLNKKDRGLWEKIINLAEDINGKVKFPFMAQGFYTLLDQNETGYGVQIVPASNFEIIEDDRLSSFYNEWKFNNVDEKGLPLDLDRFNGSKYFHVRDNGVSGVYLGGGGSLIFSNELTSSDDKGRLVLVRDIESFV